MKITVEINDVTLEHAIGQQLERVVAAEAQKQMNTIVDGVLMKKLERFDNDAIAKRIELAAKNMIELAIGREDWGRSNFIKAAVERACIVVVKERMK